ncbi:MAG: ABC transporter ATP-binding protein, partial [Limisphaerales bacterium]
VNIAIKQGEKVGIIGRNGAGKSTLLKVLSRITQPTSGRIRLKGRVASLLEVGTGFHPELTGRENIYLNGAILGMSKIEIKKQFDAIVDFAEVEKFLDTPVKRYSSGMYVRLAFSVAAHLEPDILIVDEVLAVGDTTFQKKCLGKMSEGSSQERTVLFVSHNLGAVESFCTRAIVLQHGTVCFDGPSRNAVAFYMDGQRGKAPIEQSDGIELLSAPGRSHQFQPQLKKLELFNSKGRPLRGNLAVGESLKAVITVELNEPSSKADVEIGFFTLCGQRVCTAHSAYEPLLADRRQSRHKIFICEIENLPLIPGEYKMRVALSIGLHETDSVEDAASLTVSKTDFYKTGIAPTEGVFMLKNRWSICCEP